MDEKIVLERAWTARWNLTQCIDKLKTGKELEYGDLKVHGLAALFEVQKMMHFAQAVEDGKKAPKKILKPKPKKFRKYPFDMKKLPRTPTKIPGQIELSHVKMHAQGSIPKGPRGNGWHFTSGSSAISSMEWAAKTKLYLICIGKDGKIYVPKGFSLKKWGWHAGKSSWPGIKTSRDLLGIEVDNASMLRKEGDKFVTWFGKVIPKNRVRYVEARDNMVAGYYEMFTEAQERTLFGLALWLKVQFPDHDLDLNLGHDEIAGNYKRPGYGRGKGISTQRKNDPGGALSMTMKEARQYLNDEYARIQRAA